MLWPAPYPPPQCGALAQADIRMKYSSQPGECGPRARCQNQKCVSLLSACVWMCEGWLVLYLGVRVVEAILRWHPPMAHHNLQLRGFHDCYFDAIPPWGIVSAPPKGVTRCSLRGWNQIKKKNVVLRLLDLVLLVVVLTLRTKSD